MLVAPMTRRSATMFKDDLHPSVPWGQAQRRPSETRLKTIEMTRSVTGKPLGRWVAIV
jgi:hypothetical protein